MTTFKSGIHFPWDLPPNDGETVEVAKGLHWIRLPLPMKIDHVNVYALDDGDGWSIVDTGIASGRTKAIWERLLSGPLSGKPVKNLIITHHHPDHIGLVGWFMKEHGAKLLATRTSYLMGRMLSLDVQKSLPSETLNFWRCSGMETEKIEKRSTQMSFNFSELVEPIPLGYLRLQEGDMIRMGGRDWKVRIGNGHAAEHATFWSDSDNLVIAGDQIISSISPNLGVFVAEPEADTVSEWLEACERFLTYARPEHKVFSGHKLPFTGLQFRLRQLIENHHSAVARLLMFLSSKKMASECFSPLFKRKIEEGEYYLALVESVAHLNHLYAAGKVSRVLSDKGAYLYERVVR